MNTCKKCTISFILLGIVNLWVYINQNGRFADKMLGNGHYLICHIVVQVYDNDSFKSFSQIDDWSLWFGWWMPLFLNPLRQIRGIIIVSFKSEQKYMHITLRLCEFFLKW